MVVGTLAGIVGSILSYWMGEHGGRPLLLKYGKYIFFNEHKFELAEKMFNKYGGVAIFFGRLFTWCSYIYLLPGWHGALSIVALYRLDCTRYYSLDDFTRIFRKSTWGKLERSYSV